MKKIYRIKMSTILYGTYERFYSNKLKAYKDLKMLIIEKKLHSYSHIIKEMRKNKKYQVQHVILEEITII